MHAERVRHLENSSHTGSLRPARLPAAVSFLVLTFLVAMMILGRSLARAQAASPDQKADAGPAGNAENGKRLFASLGCYKCHGNQGEGKSLEEQEDAGPRIRPTKRTLPRFLGFVRDPTGEMQPYNVQEVSDAELTDVYAYLQSGASAPEAATSPAANAPAGSVPSEQPSVPASPQTAASAASGNVQNGQRLYTSYGCYECHGGEGQGSIQTAGSRIGPPNIDFSAFLAYVRQPKGQMPPYTIKAVPDSEMADIYAFLQSRREPPPSKNIPLLNR